MKIKIRIAKPDGSRLLRTCADILRLASGMLPRIPSLAAQVLAEGLDLLAAATALESDGGRAVTSDEIEEIWMAMLDEIRERLYGT